MVDYHSRWIEILHLTTTTSSAVIAKMKDVFARLGLPQEVFSDNGPQSCLNSSGSLRRSVTLII